MDQNIAGAQAGEGAGLPPSSSAAEPAPPSWRGAVPGRANPIISILRIPEVGVLVPLLVLTLLFSLRNHNLISPGSIGSMLRGVSFVGIIAVGQTLLMITGELDLSVGWVAGLCAVVTGTLLKDYGWPVPAGLAAGVITGAVVGLVNGLFAVGIGIPAFVATLGMFYIAKGAAYLVSGGIPVYPLPPEIAAFGMRTRLGISSAFWILIGIAAVAEFVLRKTTIGRSIYAIGGNKEVAGLAGVHTSRIKIACYMLTGALAAVAGLLLMSEIGNAPPDLGLGWELQVIASVVIGGVSLFGGVGTIIGTFLGLLVLQIVRSGLATSGLDNHWQTTAVGVIMIVAVVVDILRRRGGRG